MIKQVLILIAVILPMSVYACPMYRIHRPVAHAMRVNAPALNPVAKHPVVPRRVASAWRNVYM